MEARPNLTKQELLGVAAVMKQLEVRKSHAAYEKGGEFPFGEWGKEQNSEAPY